MGYYTDDKTREFAGTALVRGKEKCETGVDPGLGNELRRNEVNCAVDVNDFHFQRFFLCCAVFRGYVFISYFM